MLTPFVIGFLLAVGCAVCWASFDIVRKVVGEDMSATAAVIGVMFWHAPFILPFMTAAEYSGIEAPQNALLDILWVGFPEVTLGYAGLAGLSIFLNLGANFLFLRSVQISPLSLTTPYLSFTPVFTAVSAFFVYDETPTTLGLVGIATVCLGAFFLNPGNREHGIWAPAKALWRERGSLYMLIVAGLWSITPVIDKGAAQMTSPIWHTMILALGVAVCFTGFRLVKDGGSVTELMGELRLHPWALAFAGLSAVGAMSLQLGSYEFIKVAYVETVKRAVGVISAIMAGYWMFGEGDIARRLLGAVVMVIGVAMVLLAGG
jgi:drug/metabolite transporter (DMT)-like permease